MARSANDYTSQVSPRVVSKIYEEYLVPLLFEEYAADLPRGDHRSKVNAFVSAAPPGWVRRRK
jgi:hypothetical protein